MEDIIKAFAAVSCEDKTDEIKVQDEPVKTTVVSETNEIKKFEPIEIVSETNETDRKCLLNLDNLDELIIDDFVHKDLFIKVCDVCIDNTKRKTSIEFVPTIPKELWEKHSEWVYIFTCDKNIVKIGGTRTGLKNRTQSYLCGRPEFRKKGTCSTTNYIIYKSFNTLLSLGHSIEMWACSLKEYMIDVENFGMTLQVPVQTYHVFEAKMLELYKNQKGHFPVLSSNADRRFMT
jgi:hypothetical protein